MLSFLFYLEPVGRQTNAASVCERRSSPLRRSGGSDFSPFPNLDTREEVGVFLYIYEEAGITYERNNTHTHIVE